MSEGTTRTDPTVEAAHRRATIVAAAMISSLFFYALAVEFAGAGDDVVHAATTPEAVRWVLYAVAVSMVFAANVAMAFMLRGFQPRNQDELVARMTAAHVVTAALAETPAVLGVLLFFLGRERIDFYFLAFISLYLLLRHFPRRSRWEQLAAQYTRGE